MKDYEVTAFELIEQLKSKQEQERQAEEKVLTRAWLIKNGINPGVVEMKKQEKVFFAVRDYDKAQATRDAIEKQENEDVKLNQEKLLVYLQKEGEKLAGKQQHALQTLLKRI